MKKSTHVPEGMVMKYERHRRFLEGKCTVCDILFRATFSTTVCMICRRPIPRELATSTIWKVCGDGYEVSPEGQVRRIGCKFQLQHRKATSNGHHVLRFRNWTWYVHRLVLEAFGPPQPPGTECRHLDGNHDNNHISNLAWGTRRENIQDFIDLHGRGIKAHLMNAQRAAIAELYKSGVPTKTLAKQFGVSKTVIYGAIKWKKKNPDVVKQ